MTVAFYGAGSNISAAGQLRLRTIVDTVANQFGPIKAKVNGIGMFANPNDGIAVVDLVDGIGTLNVRALVTQFDGLDGVKIDTRHGFTPHMTKEFLNLEDGFYAELVPEDILGLDFTFVAVGLWFNDARYEVSL